MLRSVHFNGQIRDIVDWPHIGIFGLEKTFQGQLVKDEITRTYLTPVKIIWQSDSKNNQVKNMEVLLTKFDGQLSTSGAGMCVLRSDDDR